MTKEPSIEAKGLAKYYGAAHAVTDISFRVGPGEILGCLGPNGSGKSTTMRMLCGLLAPTRGEVLFCGERITRDLPGYKRRLGYVPEEPRLYPYLSGLEYLLLVGRLRGMDEDPLRLKIAAMLQRFELRGQRHSALSAYSKGMQQKILIIAALLHDPDLLIFDEPLSGLDIVSAIVFREVVQELARTGKAILFCSHNPDVVERLCSRVVVFHQGRIVANDSIEKLREVLALPSLEHVFVRIVDQPDVQRTARDIVRVMKAR